MRRNTHHRRGSIYLPILAASMVITLLGLSAVWLTRLQSRSGRRALDYAEARLNARSAVEIALQIIDQDPDWRQRTPSQWFTDLPIGSGTCSVTVTDPDDGDLADSPNDSVVVTGIGYKGSCRHKMRITLIPVHQPLEVLRTCAHSGLQAEVKSGKSLTVTGGPLSTNANLKIDGVVDGDAEGLTRTGGGSVTGSLTVPVQAKGLPDSNVVNQYIQRAVTIPYPGGTMEKAVLSPSSNPWGLTSPDGLYYIDTGDSDLNIKGMRIWGTLVVRTGSKTLTLDDVVCIQPYRSDYPALIVDGHAVLKHKTLEKTLSESEWGVNFNPPGTPYGGQSDEDMVDEYPNLVQGLVHVTGNVKLQQTGWVRGAIVCGGTLTCEENNGIVHEPSLYTNPPDGYRTTRVRIAEGSWQKAID